jgi:hypothetical protein
MSFFKTATQTRYVLFGQPVYELDGVKAAAYTPSELYEIRQFFATQWEECIVRLLNDPRAIASFPCIEFSDYHANATGKTQEGVVICGAGASLSVKLGLKSWWTEAKQ